MPIPIDDTLQARNNGQFVLVNGILKVASYNHALGQFPDAVGLGAGAMIAALDEDYAIYKSNGTIWEAVGTSGVPVGADGQFLGHVAGVAQYVTLTQDMIAPAFAVSLATGQSTPVEIGTTVVNPQFTDTHNQAPSAASLQDVNDTQTITPPTLTVLGYGGAAATFPARSYPYPGALNSTRSWTYSATAGGITRTSSVSVQWQARVFYDVAVPGTLNQAFVLALTGSGLSAAAARTINFGAAGNTKKLYYCIPSAFANPTTFKDTSTGFGVPFSKVASAVSVTQGPAPATNYDIWASDNFLNAAVQIQVS